MKETDVSGEQTSLKTTFDKQTPEEVKWGILSQAFLASIRSYRSAMCSIDLGLDMNPDIANVTDDTLTQAAMVINTVADVESLGSNVSNWSSWDDIATQGDSDKRGSQIDIDVYMIPVQSTSDKLTTLSINSLESSFHLTVLQRFYAKISYNEYTSEYRYLCSGDVVQLWGKRNVIFHETSKKCYMFLNTTGCLEAVGIKFCSAVTRFLLCRDKMIKQHRSPLNPDLTKISGSEIIQWYVHPNHFINLEQEHSGFLCNWQTFTDSGHKLNTDTPERRAWTVQYTGPFPLVGQRTSPT